MGAGTAPTAFWKNLSCSASAGSFVMEAPPSTSEWPLRYFVVECMTMSAPSFRGAWR